MPKKLRGAGSPLATCEFHGGLPGSTFNGDTGRTKCALCVKADNDRKAKAKEPKPDGPRHLGNKSA